VRRDAGQHVIGRQHQIAHPQDDLTRAMAGRVKDSKGAQRRFGCPDREVDPLRGEQMLGDQVELHQILGFFAPHPGRFQESAETNRHGLQAALEIG